MSILLDAVNRNKQQQGNVADLMSTPPQYSSPPNKPTSLKKYGLLATAVLVGVGAAWGMSLLLVPPSTQSIEPVAPAQSLPKPAVVNPSVSKVETAMAPVSDDVRLAGKVALPLAKPFNQTAMSVPASNYRDSGSANVSQTNAAPVNSQQYSQQQSTPAQTSSRQQTQSYAEPSQQEPIVLGANANRRGLAELEALRMQVNAAAQEVDFASVKAPSIDEQNNLLAAFETALKDVEFEESVNQRMTEAKLDPIPTPSNRQIPKYGDLPASVQLQVPEFNVNAHVYATDPTNRWLNVDGAEFQQGDMIKNKLTIIEIRPRDIILDINGEQFRVPAI
ncbi:general secretion pathway protein GspB [Shewanella phaeophyticola]|uniref:General secretion pathway protein GspB n=1 Tax=Shewanella phaeophyticola TaxID=2978345 RepID=A0ABT2NZF9_9GAMM|nr:general secretion pathway protein GspB [Shewanella sp. KJ10-1]MCT8985612.1 general secretion pathway protein GspB [Shewanella sp. KJ10-1]